MDILLKINQVKQGNKGNICEKWTMKLNPCQFFSNGVQALTGKALVRAFTCLICNETCHKSHTLPILWNKWYGECLSELNVRLGGHIGVSPITNKRVKPKDSYVNYCWVSVFWRVKINSFYLTWRKLFHRVQ